MTEQLSVKDWLDQGLKTLAKHGFTALKAEPLAKAMGVSRGSFYWHFADIGAYRTAILNHWREVAAEQVIAELETIPEGGDALALLLRRTFSARLALDTQPWRKPCFSRGSRIARSGSRGRRKAAHSNFRRARLAISSPMSALAGLAARAVDRWEECIGGL